MDELEPVIGRMTPTEPDLEPTFVGRGSAYETLRFYEYRCRARGCDEIDHVRLFPNEQPTATLLCICKARAQDGGGTMGIVRGPHHPDDDAPEAPVPAELPV